MLDLRIQELLSAGRVMTMWAGLKKLRPLGRVLDGNAAFKR